jgi:hypothetical protein
MKIIILKGTTVTPPLISPDDRLIKFLNSRSSNLFILFEQIPKTLNRVEHYWVMGVKVEHINKSKYIFGDINEKKSS